MTFSFLVTYEYSITLLLYDYSIKLLLQKEIKLKGSREKLYSAKRSVLSKVLQDWTEKICWGEKR